MWQLVIVLIVVAVAFAVLARRLYRTVKGKEDLCSCGSQTCGGRAPDGFPICREADGKDVNTMSDKPKFPMARS